MKKAVCFTMTLVMIFVLCSCMKGVSTVLFGDRDNELADARMEQLFDVLKLHNNDAVKELFSGRAAGNAEDLDGCIDRLRSFVQGEVVSWDREESPMVYDSTEAGGKTKRLVTWYTLDTEEQTYLVLLVDYPIDTIDPQNAGLYAILVLRAEDESKLEGTWEDWVIPGVSILEDPL